MFLSQTTQYALSVLVEMYRVRKREGTYVRLEDLPERFRKPYIGLILNQLVKKGILRSQKGKGGGFDFKIPPNKLILWKVVEVLEDMEQYNKCVFGLENCNSSQPCPFHKEIEPIKERFKRFLTENTVEKLAKNIPESITAL